MNKQGECNFSVDCGQYDTDLQWVFGYGWICFDYNHEAVAVMETECPGHSVGYPFEGYTEFCDGSCVDVY